MSRYIYYAIKAVFSHGSEKIMLTSDLNIVFMTDVGILSGWWEKISCALIRFLVHCEIYHTHFLEYRGYETFVTTGSWTNPYFLLHYTVVINPCEANRNWLVGWGLGREFGSNDGGGGGGGRQWGRDCQWIIFNNFLVMLWYRFASGMKKDLVYKWNI